MVRLLYISIIILFQLSSISANDALFTQIKTFNETVKNIGKPIALSSCASLTEIKQNTGTLFSHHNRKSIELSILSEQRAQEVFDKLKNDEDNSFNYPLDGCYARAHKMALMMDDWDIVTGKAFIEGELYVETKMTEASWSYHVAPVVLVQKNGKIIPTVFDPSLFDHPVSYDEWKKRLISGPKSKMTSEYYTKRFNYDPDSRHDDLKDYDEEHIEDMKETIKKYARLGDMIDLIEKKENQTDSKKSGNKK